MVHLVVLGQYVFFIKVTTLVLVTPCYQTLNSIISGYIHLFLYIINYYGRVLCPLHCIKGRQTCMSTSTRCCGHASLALSYCCAAGDDGCITHACPPHVWCAQPVRGWERKPRKQPQGNSYVPTLMLIIWNNSNDNSFSIFD